MSREVDMVNTGALSDFINLSLDQLWKCWKQNEKPSANQLASKVRQPLEIILQEVFENQLIWVRSIVAYPAAFWSDEWNKAKSKNKS